MTTLHIHTIGEHARTVPEAWFALEGYGDRVQSSPCYPTTVFKGSGNSNPATPAALKLAAVIQCTSGYEANRLCCKAGSSLDPYDPAPWLN